VQPFGRVCCQNERPQGENLTEDAFVTVPQRCCKSDKVSILC